MVLDMIGNSMIYLSPHYDDAVLSCGALIRQQAVACSVKVFTVFGLPVNERAEEDSRAVKYLRAIPVSGQRYEALFREGFDPTTVLGHGLNEPLPYGSSSDPYRIPHDMMFQDLIGHEVYCPLGVGGHIDHIVVRRLASLLSLTLWYWEDLPYCFTRDPAPWTQGMVSKVIPVQVTSQEFKLWMDANWKYETQVTGLFGTYDQMVHRYRDYVQAAGGIRIWRKA